MRPGFIVFSHHEAQERWTGCHCHREFQGLVESEFVVQRCEDASALVDHIAQLNVRLANDHRTDNLRWDHRVVFDAHFDPEVREHGWVADFEESLSDDCYLPSNLSQFIHDREAVLQERLNAEAAVKAAKEAEAHAARWRREEEEREAKERAELERLATKYGR